MARGPKGTGIDVAFDGNEAVSDEALLATLPKPGTAAFFEALEGRSNRITGEARLAYARIGYLQARIGPPRQAFDAKTARLHGDGAGAGADRLDRQRRPAPQEVPRPAARARS